MRKRPYILPSFQKKKIGALHRKLFLKHPLVTTFSLFLKVSQVCNVLNKCWLPNKLANKRFLSKIPYTLLYFKKNIALSIADDLRNIQFLSHFYKFLHWMRCALFLLSLLISLLITERNINIFTQETLHLSFIFRKQWRSPLQTFFETSTVYRIFTIFKSERGL